MCGCSTRCIFNSMELLAECGFRRRSKIQCFCMRRRARVLDILEPSGCVTVNSFGVEKWTHSTDRPLPHFSNNCGEEPLVQVARLSLSSTMHDFTMPSCTKNGENSAENFSRSHFFRHTVPNSTPLNEYGNSHADSARIIDIFRNSMR